METVTIVGFALTGVTLLVFLLWTRHEVKRVDDVIEQVDRERARDEDGDE